MLALKATRAPRDPRKLTQQSSSAPSASDREAAAWNAARLARELYETRLRESMIGAAQTPDARALRKPRSQPYRDPRKEAARQQAMARYDEQRQAQRERSTRSADVVSQREAARRRADRLTADARKLSLQRQEREADEARARRVATPEAQAAIETVLRRAGRTALREPGSSGRVQIVDPAPKRATVKPATDARKRALSKTEADRLRRRAYAQELGTTPQGLGRMISNRRRSASNGS